MEVNVTPWFGSEPGRVSITDVLVHGVGKDNDRLTQADRNQVARCLVHNEWKSKRERGGVNRGKYFYIKG